MSYQPRHLWNGLLDGLYQVDAEQIGPDNVRLTLMEDRGACYASARMCGRETEKPSSRDLEFWRRTAVACTDAIPREHLE